MKLEVTDKFKKVWKWIIRFYIIIITILCFSWSPFIHYSNDKDGFILTVDVMDYHKTILITN